MIKIAYPVYLGHLLAALSVRPLTIYLTIHVLHVKTRFLNVIYAEVHHFATSAFKATT